MGLITRWMDRTLYPSYAHRWDDTQFREQILKSLDASASILDLGAGRGGKSQMNFRGLARHVAGTDVDAAVLNNPYLDEARLMDPTSLKIPFEDNYFDGVFCNSVIEHVTDIDCFMNEVHRVLKPGGWFWAKTPNRHHYVARIAGITPEWFHKFYNRLRGTQSRDIFATTYVCNEENAIATVVRRHGFDMVSLSIIEGRPEYLRIFAPMYFVGFLYERLVNKFESLKKFRCVILFHVVKPSVGSTTGN